MTISNQILIDFLRLNNRATNIDNKKLGRELNKIIISLRGTQLGRVDAYRKNQKGNEFGNPKTSMSYDFPNCNIQQLFDDLLIQYP